MANIVFAMKSSLRNQKFNVGDADVACLYRYMYIEILRLSPAALVEKFEFASLIVPIEGRAIYKVLLRYM